MRTNAGTFNKQGIETDVYLDIDEERGPMLLIDRWTDSSGKCHELAIPLDQAEGKPGYQEAQDFIGDSDAHDREAPLV